MHSLAPETDVRAMHVAVEEARLVVDLMDGRTIAVPLAWFPRLANATPQQRSHWELAGGGYGIYWPDIDEDLSTEGLLRGARAPRVRLPP
jgi:hypothetical protein